MAGVVESMKRSMPGNQAVGGILHVPYTYFPDPCGGTEVYVRGLAQRLSALGYANAVAAPAAESATYEHAGLLVHRFATDLRARLDLAYGVPDEIAAEGFQDNRYAGTAGYRALACAHSSRFGKARRCRACGGRARRLYLSYADGELRARHDDAFRRDALRRYYRDEAVHGLRSCSIGYAEAACARGCRSAKHALRTSRCD